MQKHNRTDQSTGHLMMMMMIQILTSANFNPPKLQVNIMKLELTRTVRQFPECVTLKLLVLETST